MPWTLLAEAQPTPHAKYLLRRKDNVFTAKPCYGMHSPWWVVQAISGGELEPVPMLDTDEWTELD